MVQQTQVVERVLPTAPELQSKLFRGLGDPTRIRILQLLMEGDKNVGELVELLGSPQGRVSSHLACLKQCGFAVSYREGKNVYYTLADTRVEQLLELGLQMLADNAERVLACQVIR